VDWYAQTKLGLTRTLSEENVYEDILGKRSENPEVELLPLELAERKEKHQAAVKESNKKGSTACFVQPTSGKDTKKWLCIHRWYTTFTILNVLIITL
jgi:hypothetical protein